MMGSAIFTVFIVACLYPTVLFSRRQFPERLSHITVSQDLRIDMLVPASERGPNCTPLSLCHQV